MIALCCFCVEPLRRASARKAAPKVSYVEPEEYYSESDSDSDSDSDESHHSCKCQAGMPCSGNCGCKSRGDGSCGRGCACQCSKKGCFNTKTAKIYGVQAPRGVKVPKPVGVHIHYGGARAIQSLAIFTSVYTRVLII